MKKKTHKNLDVLPDASEVIHYDKQEIPLYIRKGILSDFPGMRALCHWHEDFEFVRILEGEMHYFINGKRVALKKNDCLFVNARQMHYGYGVLGQDCIFLVVLIHPSLLSTNPFLDRDCIEPLKSDRSLPYLHIIPGQADHEPFMRAMDDLYGLKEQNSAGYELKALSILIDLLYRIHKERISSDIELPEEDPRLMAHRQMVSYIAAHYREEVTLDMIADSASVSKSTCCRIFQEFIGQSPFSFLITYRLHVSCDLLENTDKSITEIAGLCGFNHVSYYSKLFLKYYGCQPRTWRIRQKS